MGYLGTRRDMKRAADHYEKAGLLGHAGTTNVTVKYVTQSYHSNLSLQPPSLQSPPHLSVSGALGELGRLYTVGQGRELNYQTALKYLLQGAHLGDSTGTSMATLGK